MTGLDATRARLRREYRAFVRAGHPDRGGDPELFAAGLRRWQERLATVDAAATGPAAARGPVPGEPPVTVYRRGSWPVRCARALAAEVRRRRRTRVR